MTYQFAISPDVHVRDITSWFLLNTKIQRMTDQAFRATTYDDFAELSSAYATGQVDLVFANAADTTRLVRDYGFVPVATPISVADEAAVVVADDSPAHSLDDLRGSLTVAATDAPDVERICRILLEPADLGPADLTISVKRNYVLVAKALFTGEAQAGFFLQAAYDSLSELTRRRLRPVISSRIYVVRHCLLASPTIGSLVDPIAAGLEALAGDGANEELLAGLGAPGGWQRMSMDEVQFMIDLVDALAQ
jgi:phosphonate transport system substrate-binding protein